MYNMGQTFQLSVGVNTENVSHQTYCLWYTHVEFL